MWRVENGPCRNGDVTYSVSRPLSNPTTTIASTATYRLALSISINLRSMITLLLYTEKRTLKDPTHRHVYWKLRPMTAYLWGAEQFWRVSGFCSQVFRSKVSNLADSILQPALCALTSNDVTCTKLDILFMFLTLGRLNFWKNATRKNGTFEITELFPTTLKTRHTDAWLPKTVTQNSLLANATRVSWVFTAVRTARHSPTSICFTVLRII
jgi:hypothetical protein